MTGIDWLRPGIYDDVSAEDYHGGGLTKTPSLSAHIAGLLISHSPLHAWTAHPALNPAFVREEKDIFDLGTAAHSVLLQGDDIAAVCEFANWRTNAAQEAKADARKAGLIPLLEKDWQRVQAMVAAVKAQLPELDADPPLFADGKPERTIIWEEENGVICRARADWLRDDLRAIDDLKTSGQTANPHVWTRRTFWTIGCDLQACFYARGVHALTGEWPHFRFLVAETAPPYAVSQIDLASSALELGNQKCEFAIRKWGQCLAKDEWPSYPKHIASAEVDGWQEADLLRVTYGEEVAV